MLFEDYLTDSIVKTMAKRLRKSLLLLKDNEGNLAPVEIKHGACLNLVSRTLGFEDWNTLSAVLKKKEGN